MTRKRKLGSAAAIGGIGAAIAFLAGSPVAVADELADLRANQELLQKRIDQLSQAAPGSVPIPGQYVPGYGPPTGTPGPNQPVTSGSFPRSFLVPGTDTSIVMDGLPMWSPNGPQAAPTKWVRSTTKAASIIIPFSTGRVAPGTCPTSRSTIRLRIRAATRSTSRREPRGCSSTPGPRPPGARSRGISNLISPTTTRM